MDGVKFSFETLCIQVWSTEFKCTKPDPWGPRPPVLDGIAVNRSYTLWCCIGLTEHNAPMGMNGGVALDYYLVYSCAGDSRTPCPSIWTAI